MNVRKMGTKLIKKYLPGWKFGYHEHTINPARTSHRHKKITIHRSLAKSQRKQLINGLIKHEIAHAMSARSGHGKTWKTEAESIGCPKWAMKRKLSVKEDAGRYKIIMK